MSVHEREGLIARIRQISRASAASEEPSDPSAGYQERDRFAALEARVAHLEQLLQGLQDSVHRESERQSRRLAELDAMVQPAAMGAALNKDARNRGL